MAAISRIILFSCFFAALTALPASVNAQAGEDDCANAVPVVEGTFPVNSLTLTDDAEFPCGSDTDTPDEHWLYEPTCTGLMTAQTCISPGPGTVDTIVTVWAAGADCADILTGVADNLGCDDDGCGPGSSFSSEVTTFVSAGNSYIVTVAGWSGAGAVGSLELSCVPTPPFTNDDCVDATPIGNETVVFNNLGATDDGPQPCGGIGSDVWFLYEATCDGTVLASTCNQVNFDTAIAIYPQSAGCPPLLGSELGCNDDSAGCAGLTSQLTAPVTAGEFYLIQVGGFFGAQGAGSLTIDCLLAPDNDACSDATPVGDGDFAFETIGASTDGPNVCGDMQNDVWFLYTATCDGALTVSTCNQASFDTVVTVYPAAQGCPPAAGSSLGCNDAATTCGVTSEIVVPVEAGESYYIQVGGSSGSIGSGTLSLSCAPAPANDTCDNAIDLVPPVVGVMGSTFGASIDAGLPNPCGTTITAPGVWYRVIGTGTSLIVSTCTSFFDYDTKISVFCASCLVPICVAGNDNNCPGGASTLLSSVTFCSQVNAEYLILVHGGGTATGDFELNIFPTSPCTPDVECIPTGACCLPSGECVDGLQETECMAMGGAYQGDGIACNGTFIDYAVDDCANAFEDISMTGTVSTVSNSDDAGQNVPIGFPFNFFGNVQNQITISSNGYLTFGPDGTDFSNDPIPTTTDPNDAIFPYWDDWNPGSAGTVYYETLGIAGTDLRFIAQWDAVQHFSGTGVSTFQAVLFEDGSIEFRYGMLSPNSPTIGVENFDGTVGFDAAPVMQDDCKLLTPSFLDPVDCSGGGQNFVRGDVDGNSLFNGLVDALFGLAFQFQGGPPPPCLEGADVDGDGTFNGLVDMLFLLGHAFQGGPQPPLPYPGCGPDPEPGTSLGCDASGCP